MSPDGGVSTLAALPMTRGERSTWTTKRSFVGPRPADCHAAMMCLPRSVENNNFICPGMPSVDHDNTKEPSWSLFFCFCLCSRIQDLQIPRRLNSRPPIFTDYYSNSPARRAPTGRSNLSESRSRSVATIIIFAITTITYTYTRTDLRGPRGERGTSDEAARLSAGGQPSAEFLYARLTAHSSTCCGHRKSVFLVRTPDPRNRMSPYFNFPLPTAASSSRFALLRSHSTMNP